MSDMIEEQDRLDREKAHKLIQSYVIDKYFVSTAYRRASTPEEIWYYETMAWPWNSKIKDTESVYIVHEDSGRSPETAMKNHLKICESLRVNGRYEDES